MRFAVLVFIGFSFLFLIPSAFADTQLIPSAAAAGATVSISGKGFGQFRSTQDNRVLFNGMPALIQRWDPDLVVVKVPLHATSGPVEVRRGKKKIDAGSFTVTQPTIETVTPSKAEPGGILQITGSHFGNTAGSKDPNTMFGVNDVLISGVPAKIRRWRNDKIEVEIPANAASGDVVVRLASSDPLPDGSCCAPVEYSVSNASPVEVIPAIRIDPVSGPVGTKVVLFGKGFGTTRSPDDAVLINGKPAAIAQWTDVLIVVHVPLNASSGPLVLKRGNTERTLGEFTVRIPKATGLSPTNAPIGSLVRITGENFGMYSESGSTPFAFADFNKGENGVDFGGVPGIIYRWHDDRIDVWVPYSAKDGPVVVRRGATIPKPDGSCCAEQGIVSMEAGAFTVMTPRVESFSPATAGLDDIVTIKGEHFGNFLKTTEPTQPGLNEGGHDYMPIQLRENVSRSEVLFNGVAAIIVSWTDTEIKARVPRRHAFGVTKGHEYLTDTATGPLIVRRGSWDLLPDGTCCTPKRWVSVEAGQFTVQAKGLPEQNYFDDTGPLRVD
ncbi:MAG TPA: IPT/TIG domain-containing protein [Nitrospiraceae bacterium]|nr:IPT/TIG domain-containing protein [Nitrospiraceae bacterium]